MAHIIVVFPKQGDAENIRKVLLRGGFHVAAVCTSGTAALQSADRVGSGIIVCGYRMKDMLYEQLYDSLPRGFVMVLLASEASVAGGVREGIVHIGMPLKTQTLLSALEDISVNFDRLRRQNRQAPGKRSALERKNIELAKEQLMKRNNMTEEEAHRYLQKTSMDSGTNMAETAAMLLGLMGED